MRGYAILRTKRINERVSLPAGASYHFVKKRMR